MMSNSSEPTASTGPVVGPQLKRAAAIIQTEDLARDYVVGPTLVRALRGVSLAIAPGEFVAVTGPSGAGKSTFMNIVGCLDRPTSGRYWLDGVSTEGLSPAERAVVRNRKIGFVFQTFHLLPRATALENVMLPLTYAGVTGKAAEERGRQALDLVRLADRSRHHPNELSGGQQQRAAIARALVTGPSIILADEPTGNLDARTSVEIMAVLQELNEAGVTVVLVTHEADIAGYCSRTIRFEDGKVVEDAMTRSPREARTILNGSDQVSP